MGSEPWVDGLTFGGWDLQERRAVVVDWDDDFPLGERWSVWTITDKDRSEGWVRRDWLQRIEQGFEFGDETAIEGFNIWTIDGHTFFDRDIAEWEMQIA